jgi:hypothetical protein
MRLLIFSLKHPSPEVQEVFLGMYLHCSRRHCGVLLAPQHSACAAVLTRPPGMLRGSVRRAQRQPRFAPAHVF